jgi:hypothetical protein
VHFCLKNFIDNLSLAQPTSEQDIDRLKKGTFYSFTNSPSKLKILNLWGSGKRYGNNWKEHPERLEGLLAAIVKTQIKHSLEIIDVWDCGVYKVNKVNEVDEVDEKKMKEEEEMRKEKVKEMVNRQGFTNIKKIKC